MWPAIASSPRPQCVSSADEVAHRAAGDEERRFFAHALRSHRLEALDRRVVAQQRRRRPRPMAIASRMLGRGLGNGIAAQVHNALSGCHRVLPPFSVRYGSVALHRFDLFVALFPLQLGSTASSVLSDTPRTRGGPRWPARRRTRSGCGRCGATGRRRCAPAPQSAAAGASAHESARRSCARGRRRARAAVRRRCDACRPAAGARIAGT